MSNPISSLFAGNASLDKAQLDKARRKAVEHPEDAQSGAAQAPARKAAPAADELVLSPIAQKAMAEPAFDREKVEAIKQAIREGTYPLDSRRIAQSFASMEKLIG